MIEELAEVLSILVAGVKYVERKPFKNTNDETHRFSDGLDTEFPATASGHDE